MQVGAIAHFCRRPVPLLDGSPLRRETNYPHSYLSHLLQANASITQRETLSRSSPIHPPLDALGHNDGGGKQTIKIQRDSKRWTQFRTPIFPELYTVCE